MTDKQRQRSERDAQIARLFRQLRNKYPHASEQRIFHEMLRLGVPGFTTVWGIRGMLLRRGIITSKSRRAGR